MKRKSIVLSTATASVISLISLAYAANAFIPTGEPAHAVGSTCVMHFIDPSAEPLARVFIQESQQLFTIQRVKDAYKLREARAAYDVAQGQERCGREARNVANKSKRQLAS